MEPIPIRVRKNINDSPRDFAYLFEIYNTLKDVRDRVIRFDFSGCGFLQQNAVAFLGALIRLLQQHNNRVIFDLDSIDQRVRVNLEQNGFLYSLGLGESPWDGNSIPYREDTAYADDYVDYLSDRWLGRGWIHISDKLRQYIISAVIEAYINVFDHADSPIGVITCGQHYPNKRLLKLALVDMGVGIPHNVYTFLKKLHWSASEALEWAFTPNKTTKASGLARGAGLKILKSFIQENNGKLEVYSDIGYACIDANGDRFENRSHGFRGTLVQITLSADESRYTLPIDRKEETREWFF